MSSVEEDAGVQIDLKLQHLNDIFTSRWFDLPQEKIRHTRIKGKRYSLMTNMLYTETHWGLTVLFLRFVYNTIPWKRSLDPPTLTPLVCTLSCRKNKEAWLRFCGRALGGCCSTCRQPHQILFPAQEHNHTGEREKGAVSDAAGILIKAEGPFMRQAQRCLMKHWANNQRLGPLDSQTFYRGMKRIAREAEQVKLG